MPITLGNEVPQLNAFEVVDVVGKGKGVVAKRDIRDGELLVLECPVLKLAGSFKDRFKRSQKAQPKLQASFNKLSAENKANIMDLASVEEPKTLASIFCTNAVPAGNGSDVGLLCPVISRFNHSCSPNALFHWIEHVEAEAVRAVCPIPTGSEICVSYIDLEDSTLGRQQSLQDKFGFTCTCPACSLSGVAREESDARRERMAELDQSIGICGGDNPEMGLRLVDELFRLFGEEQLCYPGKMGRAAFDAFQMAVYGNRSRSEVRKWANLAYENYRKGWGEHDSDCQRMRKYMEKPPNRQELMMENMRHVGGAGAGCPQQ